MNFISPYIELPKKLTVKQNLIVYAKLYNMKNLPKKDEMLKGSQKWKPYRTLACLYLWEIIDGPFEW